jgi:hypothetical protein
MAKNKKEEVVEEIQDTKNETQPVEEKQVEEPTSNFTEDGTYKLDLNKLDKNEKDAGKELQETETEKVSDKESESQTIVEEVVEDEKETNKEVESEKTEQPVLEEVDESESDQKVQENLVDEKPGMELPEKLQKVADFMQETGGTLEDYVKLNADYSNIEDDALLRSYYQQSKPHLNAEEINFLMEDNFSFDEDVDEVRDVKRKKLAYKEAVVEARNSLETMKQKYYEEVKLGSHLAPEQQKAIDFFNRYNTEQEQVQELNQKQLQHFNKQTDLVFNKNFKGFEFNVGDKKYRYNVKDAKQTKEAQNDVLKVFSKYIDNSNMLTNAPGYHKSLFAARNPDALATHFYEQGKADAVKQITSDAKNVNLKRKTADGMIDAGEGLKVKVVSGDDSSNLKVKLKNY